MNQDMFIYILIMVCLVDSVGMWWLALYGLALTCGSLARWLHVARAMLQQVSGGQLDGRSTLAGWLTVTSWSIPSQAALQPCSHRCAPVSAGASQR